MKFQIGLFQTIEGFSKLCQKFSKKLPITVCDGIFNLSINKSTCDFCQRFFCFTKVFNAILYGLPTIYCIQLFMSLFIIPSQSIYYWQNFAKPFAKVFRKTFPFAVDSKINLKVSHQKYKTASTHRRVTTL